MRHLLPILALGVPMLVAGWRGVPCHWIAAALDPEFTGWVAPVAARFAGGFRLYTDGGHSPLPPLSFVAAYVAGLGHPIWWHESLANFFFQCLAVVAIFGAVRRIVSPVAALVVALGTFGVFVGLAKTLLYDALAQAGVAVLGYAALRWWETRSSRLLVTAALAGTVAVLSKHNTGGAALLGAGAVTLLVGRDLRASATLVLATCVSVALALLAMLPFADPMGLWVDVVRHGSEPKGGTAFLWEHLHAYRDELLS